MIRSLRERFESHVQRTEGCWLWAACTQGHYGYFRVGKLVCTAHRVAWKLYRGDIPEGLEVLHSCDNTLCVNPEHLFLGTQVDNLCDMTNKGRRSHKLTEDQVFQVRALCKGGYKQKDIARLFDTTAANVSCIARQVSWKHLEG